MPLACSGAELAGLEQRLETGHQGCHPNDTLWNISESGSSSPRITVSRTNSMNGSI